MPSLLTTLCPLLESGYTFSYLDTHLKSIPRAFDHNNVMQKQKLTKEEFIFWLPTHFSHFDTEKFLTRFLGICVFFFLFLWGGRGVLFRGIKSRKQTTDFQATVFDHFPVVPFGSIDRWRKGTYTVYICNQTERRLTFWSCF
jgi:hypothetical protein